MTEPHDRNWSPERLPGPAIALWAPAVNLDAISAPEGADVGPLSRSFVRLLAQLLTSNGRVHGSSRTPVAKNAKGERAWLLSGEVMTADTAVQLTAPKGIFVAFGFLDIGARVAGRYLAVNSNAKPVWERRIDIPFEGAADALRSMADELVKVATGEESGVDLVHYALPRDPRALRELMLGLDAAAAIQMDVAVPVPDAAFEPLLRCVKLDPACDLAAEYLLSMALTWVSKPGLPPARAVEALTRLRELCPGMVKIDAVLAEVCLTWGNASAALEAATRYLRRCGTSGLALGYAEELLGRASDLKGEPSHAASAFARAVKHDPRRIYSWRSLAHLAAQSGKLDEAELCLVQAEAIEPGNEQVAESLRRVRAELLRLRENRGPLQAPETPQP